MPVPERGEILLLSTSDTSCYLTRLEGILDEPRVGPTTNLGVWFAHSHQASRSFKRDILYIALASGKEVLRLDTRRPQKASIVRDDRFKKEAAKCDVF